MSNLISKLIVAGLASSAGLFGGLSIASEALALTGSSSSYHYTGEFYYKGDKYHCSDFDRPPSDYKHGYYRYCVDKGDPYYDKYYKYHLSKYDDNYHHYYKQKHHDGGNNHDRGNNHDDGGGNKKRNSGNH
jgi:hypothetical protein